jgi:Cu/Ag efflux pump CusA
MFACGSANQGFAALAIAMLTSIAMIFVALVVQFTHAVKPFIVFAAIPLDIVGALATLWLVGSPFGFMAFLGMASPIAVIVATSSCCSTSSKKCTRRANRGGAARRGIVRPRPVLITVAATVIALFPLAARRAAVGRCATCRLAADGDDFRDADRGAGALRDLRARPEAREWDERHATPAIEIGAAQVSPAVVCAM